MYRLAALFTACLLSLYASASATTAQATESKHILVLAAASISTATSKIAATYQQQRDQKIRVSTGSSGTLARQIMQGAPADIYISAAEDWTNQLISTGNVRTGQTQQLARNRLVFVSPISLTPGSASSRLLNTSKPLEFLGRLDGGRLAVGDPVHVPAGRYAQQALEHLGLWAAVRDRLARQVNARAVLAMVERGETPLGIVYATDAALSQNVKLAAIVPPESHEPIVYTAALLSGSHRPQAREFYNFLRSDMAFTILEENGFAVIPSRAPDQASTTFSGRL